MKETLLNEFNMKINMKKTKVLVCSRNDNIRAKIHLQNNQAIEQVEAVEIVVRIFGKHNK